MLKDQAVTRINRSLSESTDAVSDATLASVLCLAFSTHLEVSQYTCFVTFLLLYRHYRRTGVSLLARCSAKCLCSASFITAFHLYQPPDIFDLNVIIFFLTPLIFLQ